MNTFCIAGQDIKWIDLAWVEDDQIQHVERFEGAPEDYLAAIDRALADWGKTLSEIDRLFVVTGPGSFTASRVSVTIANTLAFTRDLPVHGVANPDHAAFSDLLKDVDWRRVSFDDGPLMPVYDRPPGITKPSVD